MPKVFPCYSTADRALAQELAGFLERSAGMEVLLEEGEIPAGGDLIDKVREGLSADAVLVLLSPDAVPARWVLERWKSAFWEEAAELNTAVATLLCRDCKFPDLLRRKSFFDLRKHPLAAFRAAKRWLLTLWPPPRQAPFVPARLSSFTGCEVQLESLCELLADAPGVAAIAHPSPGAGKTSLALEFARRHREDFDAVFWLTCGSRTVAALAGDLGAQLGARLDRDLETNLHEIRQLCSRHRCLLVLDDASASTAATLMPRGRTSVLITTRQEDLAGQTGASPMVLSPRMDAVPQADPASLRLLSAMCACSPAGFHLEMPSRMAGPPPTEAAGLLSSGLITALDENGPRFLVPSTVRAVLADPDEQPRWALSHARAAADVFDAQSSATQDLTAFWPDLQYALGWALAAAGNAEIWDLACRLARRGVAWARAQDRLAEAFEILESWSRAAELRADRRVLEDCAWEQIWILEHWGCWAEARVLDGIRRRQFADQLSFDFAAG